MSEKEWRVDPLVLCLQVPPDHWMWSGRSSLTRSLAKLPLGCTFYSGVGNLLWLAESSLLVTQYQSILGHPGAFVPPSWSPLVLRVSFCNSCSCGHTGGCIGRPTLSNSFLCDRFQQENSAPGFSKISSGQGLLDASHQIWWAVQELEGSITKESSLCQRRKMQRKQISNQRKCVFLWFQTSSETSRTGSLTPSLTQSLPSVPRFPPLKMGTMSSHLTWLALGVA